MKDSYFAELQCRRGFTEKDLPIPTAVTSRGSFRSPVKTTLAETVWYQNRSSWKTPTPGGELWRFSKEITSASRGEQNSYQIELQRRLVGLKEDDSFEVVISPATSSLFGSDFSDDYPTESERRRKGFRTLRGLPGLLSSTYSREAKSQTKHPKLPVLDGHPNTHTSKQTFLTVPLDDDHEKTAREARPKPAVSEKKITDTEMADGVKDEDVPVFKVSVEKQEGEEVRSRNISTSPYREQAATPTPKAPVTHVYEIKARNATPSQSKRHPPKYPYETGNHLNKRRSNRSTIHNGLLRSHRLHDYSQPSVVSSTQQLLCLTPSRGGVITLGIDDDGKHVARLHEHTEGSGAVHVKRFNENDHGPVPLAATIVTKTAEEGGRQRTLYRLMQRAPSSRPRTSNSHGFALAHLHYKHTTQIRKPYRYPALSPTVTSANKRPEGPKTPSYERNATSMSVTKNPSNTAYRIIENHVRWNRKWPVFQTDHEDAGNVYPYQSSFAIQNTANPARKMAPVLRVIPALPHAPKPPPKARNPKSVTDTEGASQKKVRFSDQIGLPLVRNATPNYRRKHSYILRWLETAGRPAKTIPLV